MSANKLQQFKLLLAKCCGTCKHAIGDGSSIGSCEKDPTRDVSGITRCKDDWEFDEFWLQFDKFDFSEIVKKIIHYRGFRSAKLQGYCGELAKDEYHNSRHISTTNCKKCLSLLLQEVSHALLNADLDVPVARRIYTE